MGSKIEAFTVQMELLDAASDGRAVGRHEGWAVFVEGGVPGDIAEVQIYRKESKALVGRLARLITPSQYRITPACGHFGDCGGCKWQHMSYEAQIKYKEAQVVNILRRIGKIEIGEALPILGVEHPYYYRNKLEFTFGVKPWITKRDKELGIEYSSDTRVLGYNAPKFFDKVLNIDECLLQTPLVNEIRNELLRFCREEEITFYNLREHAGLMRNVVFRTSASTGEVMIILIVNEMNEELIDKIFGNLESKFPQITQFIWIHNHKYNSVYSDLPYRVWKGTPYYTEYLDQYQFRIRPTSFFQTNPRQARVLYDVVRNFLRESLPEGRDRFGTVYDLYAGTGSIGMYVSELTEKIVGIEYVASAVKDAWENVRLNELEESRFSFYAGDMKDILTSDLVNKEGRPEVIITDPPRQGMDPRVVMKILDLKPDYVIYVSCKPATQARDIYMMGVWYEVLKIQPVDMFPHTAHVENVALLKRRPAAKEQVEVDIKDWNHIGETPEITEEEGMA